MLNYCSMYQVECEELDDNGCFGQWQAVQNVPERGSLGGNGCLSTGVKAKWMLLGSKEG